MSEREEELLEGSDSNNDVKFEEMEQASEYGTADFVKGAAAGAVVGSIVILT
ncbi:MAG: hypothetical protein K6D38_00225 [Pseudobutyrivibrio sp.]|nr:hypothetical protein [Pseudobutyrivibrio sp.]